MKVKIFSDYGEESGDPDEFATLETRVNQWLARNRNFQVVEIHQSGADTNLVISVWYEETPPTLDVPTRPAKG